MFSIRTALVCLFIYLTLPAAVWCAPSELQVVDEASGGHFLYGSLEDVTSGPAAFGVGISRIHHYFDAAPKLLNVVRSHDDKIMMGAFSATLQQKPVSGLMIATYNPVGKSQFGVLFDAPAAFTKTLPAMLRHFHALNQEALERMRPAASASTTDFAPFRAAAAHVALTQTAFPDGTATIGVAPGFTPQLMSGGQFLAFAEDGAYAKLYNPVSLLDPKGTLYQQMQQIAGNAGGAPMPMPQPVVEYDSNPVNAWKKLLSTSAQANNAPDPSPQVEETAPLKDVANGWTGRMMSGTMTLHGIPFVFTGAILVSPPPTPDGGWLIQITVLGAPKEHVAADMPALMAMQNSEQVDLKAIRDQTMRNIKAINEQCNAWLAANGAAGDAARNARFQQSMANAQAAQASIDNSAAAFIHYINDTALVQQGNGPQQTVSAGLASALAKSDPKNYSMVPLSQYQKGLNQ